MNTNRRALPAPIIDLIRDGVPAEDLRGHSEKRRSGGNRAVYRALVRTAMSAQQRGHTYPEWAGLVSEARSNLGRQARLDRGVREVTKRDYEATLRRAWGSAEAKVSETPAWTPEEVRAKAVRVRDLLEALPEDTWAGDATARRTLAHVLGLAAERAHGRPAVPVRPLAEALAVPRMTAHRALAWLVAEGWLDLAERGRARGPHAQQARASLYAVPFDRLVARLAPGDLTPRPASGPESQAGGFAPDLSPNRVAGAVPHLPDLSPKKPEEQPMIAVTTDASTGQVTALVPAGELPAAIRASIEALQAVGVEVREAPGTAQSAEVVDLAQRRAATGR